MLKRKKGEYMYEWINRIAQYFDTINKAEFVEVLRSVSVQGYIDGFKDNEKK